MNPATAYTDKEESPFTGKERDAETGYYYHGARFNSSDIGWLSVDPMADKYPSISPYAYCAWNPVKLVDPEGEKPELFGLLKYQGKAKFGNSHLDETRMVGNFKVIPFYDNNDCLLGYNAGRERPDGRYVTEYQMEPGDIDVFTQNCAQYEDAANLVYCAGEPDWSTVAYGHNIFSGNVKGALSELGKMWKDALKNPSFYLASALSIAVLNNYTPVKQVMRDIKSMGGKMSLNPLRPSQEFNMTITNETQKLNMRIETHPLSKQYGGKGNKPYRHMNVDYYEMRDGKWKKNDNRSKHIVLE